MTSFKKATSRGQLLSCLECDANKKATMFGLTYVLKTTTCYVVV